MFMSFLISMINLIKLTNIATCFITIPGKFASSKRKIGLGTLLPKTVTLFCSYQAWSCSYKINKIIYLLLLSFNNKLMTIEWSNKNNRIQEDDLLLKH